MRYKAEIDTLLMRYTHALFQVYLSIINFMDIYSISYEVIGGRVVRAVDLKSEPCDVGGSNPTMDKTFL